MSTDTPSDGRNDAGLTDDAAGDAAVEARDDGWAGALPPLATLVAALASIGDGDDRDDIGDAVGSPDSWAPSDAAELEELSLKLSIELQVRTAPDGSARVTGSTPTQWTETTVLPVFHALSLRLTRRADDA